MWETNGSGRRTHLGGVLALAMTAGLPSIAVAQSTHTVTGRVGEVGGAPIAGALVELEGYRPAITTRRGSFSFDGVVPGMHTIRVTAFGYEDASELVVIQRDTTLAFSLAVAPFQFDSLIANAQQIRLRGNVRDAGRDRPVVGAEIFTDMGGATDSNAAGRFEVNAWAGVPVRVLVRAFGYLPLDSVVLGESGVNHSFPLREDPVVRQMLHAAVEQIEERAKGRIAVTMRPLDREKLLRWRGASLQEVLRGEFPTRVRRIQCVVVDEEALTPLGAEGVLATTPAWDVHRMEFLFRGAMLRIYTRDFMRTVLGRELSLNPPVYIDAASPPFCA